MLADILCLRGCNSFEQMQDFLSPHLRLLAPPEQWPGVLESAEILSQSLIAAELKGESFLVWGDYDVDGITASALVLDVLAGHGIEARHHLPDRRQEGYGLNIPMLEQFAAEGVKILLTVDCGISDVEAVSRARLGNDGDCFRPSPAPCCASPCPRHQQSPTQSLSLPTIGRCGSGLFPDGSGQQQTYRPYRKAL